MSTLLALGIGLLVGLAAGVWLKRQAPADSRDTADLLSATEEDPRVRAALEHYRLLRTLSVLPVGIMVIDNEGQVTFRNDMAEEFDKGRHTDVLVRRAVDEIVHAAKQGIRSKRELRLYGPPSRHLVLRGAPVDDDDQLVGTVVSIEDTTEIHRVDEVRKDFVANVSHELKTPIGAMSLLAETLIDSDDPATVERLSGRIHQEALRLGATIDDLLSLTQIESGEGYQPTSTSMVEVVDSAVARVGAMAELRDIEIEIDVDQDLQVVVVERQLISALSNLIENGLKYSDAGSKVEIQVIRQGAWVTIDVADHGVGIPQADLDRIFERFYRVDHARSRTTGGTGLGLSIVRNVAASLGGDVFVRSVEGQGSVFTLRIPREPMQAPASATESDAPADDSDLPEEAEV